MEEEVFKFEVASNVPPYIFKEAQEIIQALHKKDPDFSPITLVLKRESDQKCNVTYIFLICVKNIAGPFKQIEYIEKVTGYLCRSIRVYNIDDPFYKIEIVIRKTDLIYDLEERIIDLEAKYNDIWCHPLMPGGEGAIDKLKKR